MNKQPLNFSKFPSTLQRLQLEDMGFTGAIDISHFGDDAAPYSSLELLELDSCAFSSISLPRNNKAENWGSRERGLIVNLYSNLLEDIKLARLSAWMTELSVSYNRIDNGNSELDFKQLRADNYPNLTSVDLSHNQYFTQVSTGLQFDELRDSKIRFLDLDTNFFRGVFLCMCVCVCVCMCASRNLCALCVCVGRSLCTVYV